MKKHIKNLKRKLKIFDPKLKEECGIFGISNTKDASALTALGLHALQHRGQEGCGIVTFDGKQYFSEKRFGLVGDNFNKEKILKKLQGDYAIGHNRYSTTGENTLRNIQPFFADTNAGGIGVAHNGNLTNSISLRKKLVDEGAIFYTTSDTETIVQLIAKSKRAKTIDKIVDAIFQIQGGYALVMLTQTSLVGVRDPFGIRPLVIGKLKNSYVLASETCALDIIGAKFIREVENGEIVLIENDELTSIKPFPPKKVRPCVFEYIYFARPDSILDSKTAYEHRKNLGAELAKENDINADIVVPVPDSGNAAALGFSQKLKINFEHGLIRNHYVGRTFIEPSQKIRSLGVKLKLNANETTIKNKKIILVGHKGHQEVIGTSGQAKMEIIDDREEFNLDNKNSVNDKDVIVLSQTTLSVRDTESTIDKIKNIYPKASIRNDICYATTNRQEVTVKLAKKVDLILVVGASNSSNCNRLRDVSIQSGTNAYLINSFKEIDNNWLKGIKKLGITSGASTPDKLVYEIVKELNPKKLLRFHDIDEEIKFEIPRKVKQLLDE